MTTLRIALTATLLLVTVACSDKKANDSAEKKPEGVIPQAQLDALNKAKNVENVIMQDAERQREQAEKESQ